MTSKRDHGQPRLVAVTGTILALTVMTILIGLTRPPLITQADLPPLNTPTPQRDSGRDRDRAKAPIAHIELQAQSAPIGAWSVVQWQDSDGNWHDVEGWRGSLSDGGFQRWAVERKDFNTGPFRWQVRQSLTDPALGSSDPFSLPAEANQTLRVTVDLP